jgi:predicted PurR-regulated permease PerM
MISLRDPSTRKMLIILLAVVLCILLLAMGGVAQMVIIAILLAYIFDPLVIRMEARGISRTAAATIILLTLTTLIVIGLLTIIPALKEQMIGLSSGESSAKTDMALSKLQDVVHTKLGWLGFADVDLKSKLGEFKATFGKRIIDFIVKDFVELVLTLVTIPFLMFFFIKDALSFKKGLIRVVPNRYFEFSLDLIYKMDQQLGNYLRGQFIDAVSIGTLATIGLGALGVPYFFLLGPFSGLANLIPYVGPFAGGIPSIIIAIMENGDLAAGGHVALLFLALKLADDLAIQPMAVSSSVHLHPALVLVTCIIGGNLFGLIGMLLSVPVTGFVKVVITESAQILKQYRFS